MRTRQTLLATACAAVLFGGMPAQAITIDIGSASSAPGGAATFVVTLNGIGGVRVNNAQLDLLLDLSIFERPSSGGAVCQVANRLAGLAHSESLPVSPPTPPGKIRLRLNVIDTVPPLGDVTNGEFYTCSLTVRGDAPLGPTILEGTRENVGDTVGTVLPATINPGTINIQGEGSSGGGMPRGNVPNAPPVAVGGAAPPAARAPLAPTTGGARAPVNPPLARETMVAPAAEAAAAATAAAGATATEAPVAAAPGATAKPAGTAAAEGGATGAATATVAQPTVAPTKAAVPSATPVPAKTPTAAKIAPPEEKSGGCQMTGATRADGIVWLPIPALVLVLRSRRPR